MLEKIKDIIYDLSDYLVTLIIIFFIVISIAFVMTKSYGLDFSKNDLLSLFNKEEIEIPTPEPEPVINNQPVVDPQTQVPEKEDEENEDKDTEDKDPDKEDEDDNKSDASKDYVLVIESGANSNSIADELEEAGVISDSYDLVNALVERGLDTAIQLGEFTFKPNMTIDQVLDILFP